MPQQAFKRIRTRQPQGNAASTANRSQYSALRLLVVPGYPEAISKAPPIVSGGFSIGIRSGGYAAIGAVAQIPGYVGYDVPPIAINGNYAFVLLATSIADPGTVTHSTQATGLSPWSVQLSSGGLTLNIDNNPAVTGAAVNTSSPLLIIGQRVGATAFAYAGGKLLGSGGTGTRTGTLTGVNFGRGRDGTNNSGQTVSYLYAFFDRALSNGEIERISANPWQLFASRTLVIPSSATVQLLRPVSDVSAGAWTPSSGLTLAPMINEAVAADASFITVSSASTSEVAFGTGLSPGVTTGHTIRFRAQGTGGLTVRLMQGTTVISSFSPTLTTAYALYTWTLSGAEAAAISNYADLRLRFVST